MACICKLVSVSLIQWTACSAHTILCIDIEPSFTSRVARCHCVFSVCLISSTFQSTQVHSLNIAGYNVYHMSLSTLSSVIHERVKKWSVLPWLDDHFGGKASLFELCNEHYKRKVKGNAITFRTHISLHNAICNCVYAGMADWLLRGNIFSAPTCKWLSAVAFGPPGALR